MDQCGIASVECQSKDLINELPDCLLSHVVLLLRLKHGAETSVVSRQWRYLWNTRPNLEFDIPNIFGDKYTRLVEKYESLDSLDDLVYDSTDNALGYNGAYAFSLLALCPGLELLHLQLFNKLENIPETDPKVFKNLKHLRLDLFMPEFDLGSVVGFLKAAPLLEELGFQGNRLEMELAVCILKIAAKLEEGNEDKNENEDVDSEDENDGEDGSMDAELGRDSA
uniref:F-box/FBD/LRR-repeat protein At4g00160-like n=1 Tax=Fragaria vesca subsp. vesca TaxID=101020 RepID=UPI0005CAB8A0|nr:PREDICTED: F-box/FBD/LRR-repeat protein At4g00160-like [Fragaria vesca subsp. vesca]